MDVHITHIIEKLFLACWKLFFIYHLKVLHNDAFLFHGTPYHILKNVASQPHGPALGCWLSGFDEKIKNNGQTDFHHV